MTAFSKLFISDIPIDPRHAASVAGQNRATELDIEEIHALIEAAARRHGVPIALVKGIVATESNFHCHVVSPRGAADLMQLTQSTARQFGAHASVPEQNIEAGTRYLRFLIEKYRNKRNPIKCAIAAIMPVTPQLIVTRAFHRSARRNYTQRGCWRICRIFRATFDQRESLLRP